MSELVHKGSWVDRLIDWIDRLPGPVALFYLAAYLVATLAAHIALWLDGIVDPGTIDPEWIANPIWGVLSLIWIHYLKHVTRRALNDFEPILHDKPGEFAALEDRMLYLPRRLSFWLSIVAAGLLTAGVVSDPAIVYEGLNHPIAFALVPPIMIFAYTVATLTVAYTIGLLRAVTQAFRVVTTVDVIHPRPLFALTNITVQSGLLWILVVNLSVASLVFIENSGGSTRLVDLSFSTVGLVIAIASFLLPLRGIHRRLDEAKAALIEENAAAVNRTRIKLYAALDRDDHTEVDSIDKGLTSLLRLRDELRGIKTWPWKPGTLRTFASAVVLPILVWSTQQMLTRFV
jgi:hypothetical protein